MLAEWHQKNRGPIPKVPSKANPDWNVLQRSISGQVILPDAESYRWKYRSAIARYDKILPKAVVCCGGPQDVAEVIRFARLCGIETATRSGGHSYAGYSSTDGIIIDLTPMSSVVSRDGVVKVGGGAHLEQLNATLHEHDLAIPTGTCPSVGIGGLTLGGGLGVLGRQYGLTLDHLLEAQVVLADSSIISCDEHHYPDLFWALRGAGAGNFGVVTSFTFRPIRAPRMTNFLFTWPIEQAATVIKEWQDWAPTGPDELSADLILSDAMPESAPVVGVYGAVIAPENHARKLIQKLINRTGGPDSEFCIELPYYESTRFQGERTTYELHEITPNGMVARHSYRYTKSEFFDRPLPEAAIQELVHAFTSQRSPAQRRSLEFAPWGGAYNRHAPEATAFVHRDQLFILDHTASVDPKAPETDKEAARAWVTRSWSGVHACASGQVYQNFTDPELDNWERAYYGQNLRHLIDVKARYDEDGFFRFRQSLPVR